MARSRGGCADGPDRREQPLGEGTVSTTDAPGARAPASEHQQVFARYCVSCHNDTLKTAGLSLSTLDVGRVGEHAEVWEKVAFKLRARFMPPSGRPRPDEATYESLVDVPGDLAGPGRRGGAESGADRRVAAAESDRIPERDPGSAGAERGCDVAAAERRCEPRLRQRESAGLVDDLAGALHYGGAEDQPVGRRESGALSGCDDRGGAAGSDARGARGRAAVRHARRHGVSVQLSAGRRVRHPAPAGARSE